MCNLILLLIFKLLCIITKCRQVLVDCVGAAVVIHDAI